MPRPPTQFPQFSSVADVEQAAVRRPGYLPDAQIATTVFLADRLGKPLLVEGPAGTGKTELAKALADRDRLGADPAAVLRGPRRGAGAVRVELQEAAAAHPGVAGHRRRGLGRRPRRHLRRGVPALPAAAHRDPARPSRPCCSSTRPTRPTSRSRACCWRCCPTSRSPSPSSAPSPPTRRPMVVLTSNATRELSEALKRRCLYLHLDYPTRRAREGDRAVPGARPGAGRWPTSWCARSGRCGRWS